MHHLLHDVAFAVIAATIAGLLCHAFRQPIILGYVIAGVSIGPQFGLGLIDDVHTIEIISELGLVLLLFIIGLEIDLRKLLSSGRLLLTPSAGQFPLCALLGFGLFSIITVPYVTSSLEVLYLALLCSLSSTAIVVKALYDKSELDTLPGRLTLGTLVLQDIYAILVLAVQPTLSRPDLVLVLQALASTILLIACGFAISKIVLSRLFRSISKSPEMVVCLSLAWCATMAAIADLLGNSREMGALIAGVCVAAFPYSVHVTAKTLPLRDFFLTLFFVSLGMKMTLPSGPILEPVLIFSAFILASRFLTIYPLVALSGGGRRAAFLTSLNLSQLGEFALVIGSIGLTLKHLPEDLVSVLVLTMVLLSIVSSYAMRFSHSIYSFCNKLLSTVWSEQAVREYANDPTTPTHDIVLLGFHRGARGFINSLRESYPELLEKVLVIDFNPVTLGELKEEGVSVLFGDIGSYDTLKHAHLERAKVIVSSIPDMLLKGTNNNTLVRISRSLAESACIVATADDPEHEQRLLQLGADFTVRPFALAGERLRELVVEAA